MAWVGGLSSRGGLERCLRWGFSGGWGGGQQGWLGRGAEGMRGQGAEALEEAGARRGGAGGGCSRRGALPRARDRGSPERVPRGYGGRYLKLGGEARCSPRKGEEAGGDAAPFSRSAILWLSPCRRRAGGREGGREGGMKGGGCWRCRRGGTYLPPGRGARPGGSIPRLPAAAAGQARHRWERHLAPGPHPLPRASGNAGPGGAGVPAAGGCTPKGRGRGRPGSPKAGRSNPRSGAGWPSGQAAAQGEGLDTEGHLQGSLRQRGGAWRQQEQQEQPRCALAGLQHLATGLAAPLQALSLSKLTRAASTAKGI